MHHSGQSFVRFLVHLSDLTLQKIIYGQHMFFFHAWKNMAVQKEVAYRIGVQEAAANKLTEDELRVVYQLTPSIKPSQYLANK
jgi:hypothetical protein